MYGQGESGEYLQDYLLVLLTCWINLLEMIHGNNGNTDIMILLYNRVVVVDQ